VLEKIKSAICEIIDLYVRMYEEEFKLLPQFVQTIWSVLTTTSTDAKNDIVPFLTQLVSKAITFLTAVVKPIRHKAMFDNMETLQRICSDIILPNMTLRESDEELFEDDPVEFIRRDLEGSGNFYD
jgi:exportin-2 (importin alpha re-exporter)